MARQGRRHTLHERRRLEDAGGLSLKRIQVLAAFALSTMIASAPVSAAGPVLSDADYRADAMSFEGLVNERYAYLDRFEGGQYRLTDNVRQEATAVHDPASLLTFLE